MSVIYHEEDGNLNVIEGKLFAVVGYGNMGRPVALNLRDSGMRVIVTEPSAEKREIAIREGFTVMDVGEAVARAEIILLMFRDEEMPKVYLEEVSPRLRRGHTLIFSSAYNIAFGLIEPPSFVDVGLVSPRTVGAGVRHRYISDEGFSSFVAVAQDASSHTWPTVLAIAKAIGALRWGAVELRFEQEAELDLFMQQAILPILHQAVTLGVQLLMRMGYPPEAVFTEMYLSGETSDYLRQSAQIGMMNALKLSSLTAQYGTLSRYERFEELDFRIERMMELVLEDIRNGKFAQEWTREYLADYPRLETLFKKREAMEMWELEQQTIDLFRRESPFGFDDEADQKQADSEL